MDPVCTWIMVGNMEVRAGGRASQQPWAVLLLLVLMLLILPGGQAKPGQNDQKHTNGTPCAGRDRESEQR